MPKSQVEVCSLVLYYTNTPQCDILLSVQGNSFPLRGRFLRENNLGPQNEGGRQTRG